MPLSRPPTRVLIVDDSAIVRKMIGDALRGEPDIEVVGGAADPFIARDMILQHRPDLVTLDIEMPRMDGLTFLRKLMQHHPMPVIIVSSVTKSGSAASVEALRAGAVDVIPKPGGPSSVGQVTERLKERIRSLRATPHLRLARQVEPSAAPAPVASGRRAQGLLLIGASTGGPQAIEAVLTRLPADIPPTLIVQHMPANFTAAFAGRLNTVCPMRVIEAQGGETLERGTAYIAPGDHHLLVERMGVQLRTVLRQGPPVHHQRPAVDVLFHSAARLQGVPRVAVVLTGMGADGADGLLALRQAGAETIAEDEHSCVVFGMPKEAIARGGAAHVATLLRMPGLIYECFDTVGRPSRRAG
ncbi:MAG: chemotaxis response regulator protein-glutamate methylesterase [Vicinamibacterales bacterium]|nr:chemotaxis response regulator protein-glutamate methylesterase [Vicinamibacterales bacterium]